MPVRGTMQPIADLHAFQLFKEVNSFHMNVPALL